MTEVKTQEKEKIIASIKEAISDLVSIKQVGPSHFVRVPLLYPDGSFVTLRIDPIGDGVRVSDSGFAYREAEAIGAESSFGRTAKGIAQQADVSAGKRSISVDVPVSRLTRAVCDVSTVSWKVAETIYSRHDDKASEELDDHLRQRLAKVFGERRLADEHVLKGRSSSEWNFSAVINIDGRMAVFQAVSPHPNSVFRTNSAFHDLSILDSPPTLIAVVPSKEQLGPRLGLLSQAGRVIEADDPDEVYRNAIAA